MEAIAIKPRDRLGFTLFLALALHGALILGIAFDREDPSEQAPTIEVTLATHASREAPENADFIASSDQLGGGEADELLETTTDRHSDFATDTLQDTLPVPIPAPDTQRPEDAVVTSTADAEFTANPDSQAEMLRTPQTPTTDLTNTDALSREIATLEARIAEQAQADAQRTRVKRLTSVSTKTAVEAAYLNSWRQRVERVGNANYPPGVFGDLRMLVVVEHDGALSEVSILKSSGNRQLDEAALRIVRLAAPFPDFPVEMRKQYDRLEIIRTWEVLASGSPARWLTRHPLSTSSCWPCRARPAPGSATPSPTCASTDPMARWGW